MKHDYRETMTTINRWGSLPRLPGRRLLRAIWAWM